jgi:hypothetical protein
MFRREGAMARALIFFVLAACLTASSAAAREPAATSPEAMTKAQVRLTARMEAAGLGAPPPLLSNSEDATLLRVALDPRGLGPVTVATLGDGLASCDVSNRYNVALAFIGSRRDEFKNTPPEEAVALVLERTTKNLAKHQDEMALALRFSAVCTARLVKPAADFWATLPEAQRTQVRLEGLRRMRDGISGVYIGIIITQGEPGIREANRLLLLDTLLEYNASLAQGLSPQGRRKVIDAIASTMPSGSVIARERLTRLHDELTALPCLDLCSI